MIYYKSIKISYYCLNNELNLFGIFYLHSNLWLSNLILSTKFLFSSFLLVAICELLSIDWYWWYSRSFASGMLRNSRNLVRGRLSSLRCNSLWKSELICKGSRSTSSCRTWSLVWKVDHLLIVSTISTLSDFVLTSVVRVVPWGRQTTRFTRLMAATSLTVLSGVFIR